VVALRIPPPTRLRVRGHAERGAGRAAVDHDLGRRDVGGIDLREEQGDPGEFFRLADAAKRDCRDQFLLQHCHAPGVRSGGRPDILIR
jgi:hypothetical protein